MAASSAISTVLSRSKLRMAPISRLLTLSRRQIIGGSHFGSALARRPTLTVQVKVKVQVQGQGQGQVKVTMGALASGLLSHRPKRRSAWHADHPHTTPE
jgi:hypothetical protein